MFPVSSENLSLDKKTDNNISLWLRNLCKLDFFKRSDVHTFITFQKYKPYAWCNDMINTISFVIILEYKISHLDQVLVIRTRNKVLLSNKWHYFKFWNISSFHHLISEVWYLFGTLCNMLDEIRVVVWILLQTFMILKSDLQKKETQSAWVITHR